MLHWRNLRLGWGENGLATVRRLLKDGWQVEHKKWFHRIASVNNVMESSSDRFQHCELTTFCRAQNINEYIVAQTERELNLPVLFLIARNFSIHFAIALLFRTIRFQCTPKENWLELRNIKEITSMYLNNLYFIDVFLPVCYSNFFSVCYSNFGKIS